MKALFVPYLIRVLGAYVFEAHLADIRVLLTSSNIESQYLLDHLLSLLEEVYTAFSQNFMYTLHLNVRGRPQGLSWRVHWKLVGIVPRIQGDQKSYVTFGGLRTCDMQFFTAYFDDLVKKSAGVQFYKYRQYSAWGGAFRVELSQVDNRATT